MINNIKKNNYTPNNQQLWYNKTKNKKIKNQGNK